MVRVWARFVAAALILGACGGGTANDAATTVAGSQAVTTAPNATTATTRPTDTEVTTAGPANDRCEALFTTAEMTELFGEEAPLDEASADETLEQLVCVWQTPEKPDFSYRYLLLQLYGGDPIPGESFFDPSFYPDAQPLDGIGDQALLSLDAPDSFGGHFLDGLVYGTINYSEGGPGTPGGPEGVTEAEAIDLLTKFHDRAT